MPRKKKGEVVLGVEETAVVETVVETTTVETPIVETVAEETPVVVKNTVVEDSATIVVENKIDGRKLGNDVILKVTEKELNGRFYKEVVTISGLTFLLSEKDFESQLAK